MNSVHISLRLFTLIHVFYFCCNSLSVAQSIISVVTARFENPVFDVKTSKYCVDVELLSNTENIRLFGMNVRFFYEKGAMDFYNFTDFRSGYGAISPNPPLKNFMAQGSGSLFGFNTDAVFINGAVQLTNFNENPSFLSSSQWTKIFCVCFKVSHSKLITEAEFKPKLVWDLEENSLNGGFMPGSEGVVITVIGDDSKIISLPVLEKVIHHNWK